MTDAEIVEIIPDVSRIAEGLRDTGYDLNSAIADIVDNSIAAKASSIQINLGLLPSGDLSLSIGDNGIGMTREGLENAMRYGSAVREDKASLGKFGLGLKTASTAFARRLVVVTRSSGDGKILRAEWDLDRMAASNRWDLHISGPSKLEADVVEASAPGTSGSVVFWENIDRILQNYKSRNGRPLTRALNNLTESLEKHLAMVFQRYLDPHDPRAPDVQVTINSKPVTHWDPFCVATNREPVMQETQKVELPDGQVTSFTVRAFILPRKEEFPSAVEREAARISNDLQGIFVYRENRLIHGPDWLGKYRSEPHFSLIRIELSFDHHLDEAFQVDIKKSRILLMTELHDWLFQFLEGPRREAENRYRRGQAQTVASTSTSIHQRSDSTINRVGDSLTVAKVLSTDTATNEARIENNLGTSTTPIRIVINDQSQSVFIATAPTLDDGVLWETSLIGGANGVTLNTNHPYYRKAYLPHKDNAVIVQALDFLLWSLAQAELNNSNTANRDALTDFRIDVSKNLKRLVTDLPEPVDDQVDDGR